MGSRHYAPCLLLLHFRNAIHVRLYHKCSINQSIVVSAVAFVPIGSADVITTVNGNVTCTRFIDLEFVLDQSGQPNIHALASLSRTSVPTATYVLHFASESRSLHVLQDPSAVAAISKPNRYAGARRNYGFAICKL
jgi:hypothetical protein